MYHHTRIEIDTKILLNNIKNIKSILLKSKPNIRYCLPVKANAYGHGLVGITNIVQHEVDYFGVACLDEGIKLRLAGIIKPILVFGAFLDNQVDELIYYDLELTVSSLYKAKLIAAFCDKNKCVAKIHIKIDTGMNRVGVRPDSANELINFVMDKKCFELKGIYSHLASSDLPNDDFTIKQIKQFSIIASEVKNKFPQVICHLANSGGVLNYSDSLFDMVRPGILTYGYLPSEETRYMNDMIVPCLSLYSNITYFKVVAKNEGISYNHKYITKNITRVVTIPVGYGDGYRRALSNKGELIIRGTKYKICGTVCMDMVMVDIGVDGEAYIGDEVVLIGHRGSEAVYLTDVAKLCGTITYEILCGFNERIPRMYK